MPLLRNLAFQENLHVVDQNKNKTCKMIRTWQKMLKVAACAKLKKISKINLSPKILPKLVVIYILANFVLNSFEQFAYF